jgi:hypothetical protein
MVDQKWRSIDRAAGFFLRFLGRLILTGIFGLAAAYIALCFWSANQCWGCNGPGGDVWMIAFFLSPIGVPAVFISICYLLWKLVRFTRTGASAATASNYIPRDHERPSVPPSFKDFDRP